MANNGNIIEIIKQTVVLQLILMGGYVIIITQTMDVCIAILVKVCRIITITTKNELFTN